MKAIAGQGKCMQCGKDLEKMQRYRHGKYCSRKCFADARFGGQVNWSGIETRNLKFIEAAKLCRTGKTQAEAAQILGVHPQTVSTWFTQY